MKKTRGFSPVALAGAASLGLMTGFAPLSVAPLSSAHAAPMMKASITQQSFGTLADGRVATLYTLSNARGTQVKITNYGGIVTSLRVRDRRGRFDDVVLGYSTLGEYVKNSPYFGALIGRYGNRIAKGRFSLDGQTYTLAKNNGPNSLHGGKVGFDKQIWSAQPLMTRQGPALSLRLLSPNGQEGYPGNLSVHVIYTLTQDNALRLQYSAVTDRATVFNPTHHSYFNLAGAGSGTIYNHRLMLNASRFTPVDSTLIPTGELRRVRGTPFDFLTPHAIGSRINANNQQLKFGKGYDHNFVLNGRGLRRAARVYEPTSGRVMTVSTNTPGIQLYTGNFLDGTNVGKGGKAYNFRGAFCLEAQGFPDSPNHPRFPTTTLRPGQVYHQTTIYRFSVAK